MPKGEGATDKFDGASEDWSQLKDLPYIGAQPMVPCQNGTDKEKNSSLQTGVSRVHQTRAYRTRHNKCAPPEESILLENKVMTQTMGKALGKLWQQQKFCDVQLKSKDCKLTPAHRCVLAAASKVLHKELAAMESTSTPQTLVLNNLCHTALDAVLKFMYFGQADVALSELRSVHQAAQTLGISKLVAASKKFLNKALPEKILEGEQMPNSKTEVSSNHQITPMNESHVVSMSTTQEEHELKLQTVNTEMKEVLVTAPHLNKDLETSVFIETKSNPADTESAETKTEIPGDGILPRRTNTSLNHAGPSKSKQSKKSKVKKSKVVEEDGNQLLQCNQCDALFKNRYRLYKHTATEHREKPKEKKVYKCDPCKRVFGSSSNLKTHNVKYHSGDVSVKCELCDKVYKNPDTYKHHVKFVHIKNNVRDYLCQDCGKSFKILATFRIHQMACGGHRPFKCKVCGESFPYKRTLNQHLITHSDEFPHQCTTCGKRFGRIDNLRVHMRIHTGEKPYACSLCEQSFRVKCLLSNHEKSMHGIDPRPAQSHGAKHVRRKNPDAGAAMNNIAQSQTYTDHVPSTDGPVDNHIPSVPEIIPSTTLQPPVPLPLPPSQQKMAAAPAEDPQVMDMWAMETPAQSCQVTEVMTSCYSGVQSVLYPTQEGSQDNQTYVQHSYHNL